MNKTLDLNILNFKRFLVKECCEMLGMREERAILYSAFAVFAQGKKKLAQIEIYNNYNAAISCNLVILFCM